MSKNSYYGYFIKPIPKETDTECDYPKCRNKGGWNINNGKAVYCDKHLLKMMKEKEGEYIIINKSIESEVKT